MGSVCCPVPRHHIAMHALLLVQLTRSPTSRTYYSYTSINDLAQGVIDLFETHLKQKNKNVENISYNLKQLYKYIDGLGDIAALVLNEQTLQYMPKDKEWVKEKILNHLKRIAGQ